jgi:hypothetical protein
MGKTATVQVNSTHGKPGWIWDVVARCGSVNGQAVPQYWNPAYLTLQSELVNSLAAAIRAYPHPETVALVRASSNAIGTELTMLPRVSCTAAAPAVTVAAVVADRRPHLLPKRDGPVRLRHDARHPRGAARRGVRSRTGAAQLAGPDGAWIMGTASDIDYNPSRDAFDVFAHRWDRAGRTVSYWEPISYQGKHNVVSWNYWRILLELYKGVSYIAVYGEQIRHGGNPSTAPPSTSRTGTRAARPRRRRLRERSSRCARAADARPATSVSS